MPLLEAEDAFADFFDRRRPNLPWPKSEGGTIITGVVAALVNLEIRTAGESDLYFDEDLPFSTRGIGTRSILRSSLPYKNGGGHFFRSLIAPCLRG